LKRWVDTFFFIVWLLILPIHWIECQDLPQVCGGSKVRYAVKVVENSVFDWDVTGGTIIANNNNSIDIEWDQTEGIHMIKVTQHSQLDCLADPVYGYVMVTAPCKSGTLNDLIPNAFTPNGDGDNETWRIDLLLDYREASVSVFNRWGQLVYRAEKGYPSAGWDGTSRGKLLPMDTYFYVIDLKDGKKPLVGSVNLIR
jgi:gliding motility-associated-like protein